MTNVGRPRKEPPSDAAQRIRELSSEGHSQIGIANMLGVSEETLRRWMREDPELKEQYDLGREKERLTLTNLLYQRAMGGDAISAMFLLKARHGYKEGEQPDTGNRVNITFQLPAALPLDSLPVIEHANPSDRAKPVPATGFAITRTG